MASDWADNATRRAKASLINPSVPNAARVINCLFGGQRHFEADRRAARAVAADAPGISGVSAAARAFRQRTLRYLVEEAGIRQFLDVGTGLPLRGSTHEVTESLGARCRVVYVDDDPMVLSHARALLKPARGTDIGYVDADLRDTETLLAGAHATLDPGQPAAVLLMITLSYLTDGAEAAGAVAGLMKGVPSGSYVVISHLASDLDLDLSGALRTWNGLLPTQPLTLRSGPEVAALTAGLDPVEPGLVPIADWRPDPDHPAKPVPLHGLVARKP